MSVRLIHGSALALPLADDSVDLVVTSPPYFSLRSYTENGDALAHQVGGEASPDEYVDALIAATREAMRVLKPSGSIWVNLGDKYASSGTTPVKRRSDDPDSYAQTRGLRTRASDTWFPHKSLMGLPWRYALRCIDELGLILRAEIIWDKPNGLPESVRDRVRRSHEQWFHFTLSPRYYANVDEIREPHVRPKTAEQLARDISTPKSSARRSGTGGKAHGDVGVTSHVHTGTNPLGKLPGSVWRIATQPLRVPAELGIDHFAAFPMAFPGRIVQGWSPPGGTVLDPFGGTGTTALVADVLGRDAISVDLSYDYCRLAQWRVTDAKQRARAAMVKA